MVLLGLVLLFFFKYPPILSIPNEKSGFCSSVIWEMIRFLAQVISNNSGGTAVRRPRRPSAMLRIAADASSDSSSPSSSPSFVDHALGGHLVCAHTLNRPPPSRVRCPDTPYNRSSPLPACSEVHSPGIAISPTTFLLNRRYGYKRVHIHGCSDWSRSVHNWSAGYRNTSNILRRSWALRF